MAESKPKTNADLDLKARNLSKLIEGFEKLGGKDSPYKAFQRFAELMDSKDLDEFIKKTKNLVKTEEKRLDVFRLLKTELESMDKLNVSFIKRVNKEISSEYELLEVKKRRREVSKQLVNLSKAGQVLLDRAVASNQKIFEISHKMQLESNVTWENYRKIYQGAYETTRKMREEIGQSVYNVKDLINTQERMLGAGWRNMNPATLTEVSASVMNLSKTLGTLDVNLVTAFQQSFRIFGEETSTFIDAMGNRLNAFSKTFGISIGMLQGAVSDLIDANNFISRNNMEAQITANQSLMRAAALSASVGLTTTTFITQLAKTSQWGTMEEMAGIYEGGALLQGFDTAGFQQQMIGQDYAGATKQLFGSINETLNSIDDHYLRAEYMQRIGSTFGLSNDELLRIATHGSNLEAYDEATLASLEGVNTSMRDELADLKVSVVDRLENWYEGTRFSQSIGSVMQELGLYGLNGMVKSIVGMLAVIVKQNAVIASTGGSGGGILNSMGIGSGSAQATGLMGTNPMGLSTGVRAGGTIAGIGIAGLGNDYFGDRVASPERSQGGNIAGMYASGIGGGALAGGMIGGPIGAGIGAVAGGIYSAVKAKEAKEERQSAIEELDAERRDRARAASGASFITGDPVVDAINAQTDILKRTLDDNYEENRRQILIYDTMKKTNAAID